MQKTVAVAGFLGGRFFCLAVCTRQFPPVFTLKLHQRPLGESKVLVVRYHRLLLFALIAAARDLVTLPLSQLAQSILFFRWKRALAAFRKLRCFAL